VTRAITASDEQPGECGDDQTLTGFYFREARHLRTLRLELNGNAPWLCDAVAEAPDALACTYVYPELTQFGGGGAGQSQDKVTRDADAIPHRVDRPAS
jgi:hypothetical protein